jgi:uncharacterized protein
MRFSLEFQKERYQNNRGMSIKRVLIESDHSLEGIVRENKGNQGVVICHPHPLYGGNMGNNVVAAMEEGFARIAFTTLRFNFRGVGGSEGDYDDGAGEVLDALAAGECLRRMLGGASIVVLAGYSFGAWIAAKAALQDPSPDSLFLVSYPFAFYPEEPILRFTGPQYFVGGSYDEIGPVDRLLEVYKKLPVLHKNIKIIPTDHFYGGKEQEIADFIAQSFWLPGEGAQGPEQFP